MKNASSRGRITFGEVVFYIAVPFEGPNEIRTNTNRLPQSDHWEKPPVDILE